MVLDENYRRKGDEETRLLIVLNERVVSIQQALKERLENCETDIKTVEAVQNNNPCKTHDLRLKNLEKILWIIVSVIILLLGEVVFSFFKR